MPDNQRGEIQWQEEFIIWEADNREHKEHLTTRAAHHTGRPGYRASRKARDMVRFSIIPYVLQESSSTDVRSELE